MQDCVTSVQMFPMGLSANFPHVSQTARRLRDATRCAARGQRETLNTDQPENELAIAEAVAPRAFSHYKVGLTALARGLPRGR